MRLLCQGMLSKETLALYLKLTSIRSEAAIEALEWHLVKGHSVPTSCQLAEIPMPNFNRAYNTLNDVATIVEEIKRSEKA